jgi:hypothetical protein
MDITLALLPWKLIWGLNMKKQEKIGVAIAMSCGILYVSDSSNAAKCLTRACSAGITAIIKTAKIPSMLALDSGKSTSTSDLRRINADSP